MRTTLEVWKYDGGGSWTKTTGAGAEAGAEAGAGTEAVAVGEDVAISAVWPDASDELWVWRDGFLVPSTLELASAADACASPERLKAMPQMFDATGLVVTQHFATSADGTRVPYFVQRRADLPMDGSNPTLLDAYGGFEISMLPYYSGGVGVGWLERGGVKVIANIRGGGEYGPTWHQAALKANR